MKEIINQIYQQFSMYSLQKTIDYCDHCVNKDEARGLSEKPLKKLSHNDLLFYYFKGLTTFGGVREFKYLLPRILELFVTDYSSAGVDLDPFIFGKFKHADWQDWPTEEKKLLQQFFKEFYQSAKQSTSLADWEKKDIINAIESITFELNISLK